MVLEANGHLRNARPSPKTGGRNNCAAPDEYSNGRKLDGRPNMQSITQRIRSKDLPGQVVLVLQGGGALGSYQAGVYQALHEAGIEPDWIIGTSIGAINASLIAGNEPQGRLAQLKEFWKRMEQNPVWNLRTAFPGFNEKLAYWSTITNGIPGFFRPNPLAHAAIR
jgi:NTE family protein